MGDDPVILALNDGVVDVVVHAGFALPQQAEFTLGVVFFEDPHLRGHLGAHAKEEVFIGASAADANVEVFIFFLEHLHVFGLRGADLVAPDGVGAPCLVDGRVKDIAVANPGGTIEDALEVVVEKLAGV